MNWKFWERREKTAEDTYTPFTNNKAFSGLFGVTKEATSLSSVFAAVELISNSIAELPVYVKQHKDGKQEIVEGHTVYRLLNGGQMTKFMFIKSLIADVLLYGDGLAYIDRNSRGVPVGLYYCKHGTYRIAQTTGGLLGSKIIYQIDNLAGRRKNVEPVNVIHLYKNSVNGYSGRGVIDYASDTLNLASYQDKTATAFFKNGLHISGVLETDKPALPNVKKQEILDSWRAAHGNPDQNGICILEGGMHYHPVTINGKEAQLLETRLFSLQEVARYFNISPALLGDLSKASYGTLEAANLEFVTHTLQPFITLIEEEFQRKLLLPNEQGFSIDLDETYLIRTDKQSMANYLSTLVNSGIITINEARKRLGYNGIDGGDKNIIAYTNIEQNTINDDKNTEAKEDEQE